MSVTTIEALREMPAQTNFGEDLERPVVRGKFLFANGRKFYVRGTTYGTFALDEDDRERFDSATVERDFALMAANGINAVRIYTVPPRWLLDAAYRFGLRVMVGLPWEQHIAFLDEPGRCRSIEARLRADVKRCANHPAVLCYAVGNEIPSNVVRWLGRERVERFIERLYRAVKAEDPTALVTYVNFPTTEYLQLPFLDFVAFNVYLENEEPLRAYLARLHNLAGDRPLVMAEVGLDSRRNGEAKQAEVLDWQLRTIFASGCAGTFAYAWTDEWHRGGFAIDDWDFGLTRRDRTPKPALTAVRNAFAQVPFRRDVEWPRISVVVCAYNAGSTIRECLDALTRVDYPNFEAIVVNDGSTDATGSIAADFPVRLITTENRGLSNARNTGLKAATGEIVAYLDSDAFPDPQWLKYLAWAFIDSDYQGIGGPNLAPPGLGLAADCFDNAPGGPAHVLVDDRDAEHVPGCNMAFRRLSLLAIGGFDPALRIAGDDVDICWRLQERGWKLGFSPAAVVWHHRRTTLRSYWKQQRGYGRAEALLERKWPQKYNAMGHPSWGGRIYSKGVTPWIGFRRPRIYQGAWGAAPYQSLERAAPGPLSELPLMPEWYLLVAALALFCGLGAAWPPLLLALPLLAFAVAMPVLQAVAAARQAVFETEPPSQWAALRARASVGFLHLAQPLARLAGRLEFGLTCWRTPVAFAPSLMRPRSYTFWNERWRSSESWLEAVESSTSHERAVAARGAEYDPWDLQVSGGALGSARLQLLVEEHEDGKQLGRIRTWPVVSALGFALIAFFSALAVLAGFQQAWAACAILQSIAVTIAIRMALECAAAMARFDRALGGLREILNRQR
ncbi:MAG TPA: glycosyltransferase [Candidatus Cybelea sp.]|nr:glycosyltransferase [Candidatus Cybelea sp.]